MRNDAATVKFPSFNVVHLQKHDSFFVSSCYENKLAISVLENCSFRSRAGGTEMSGRMQIFVVVYHSCSADKTKARQTSASTTVSSRTHASLVTQITLIFSLVNRIFGLPSIRARVGGRHGARVVGISKSDPRAGVHKLGAAICLPTKKLRTP